MNNKINNLSRKIAHFSYLLGIASMLVAMLLSIAPQPAKADDFSPCGVGFEIKIEESGPITYTTSPGKVISEVGIKSGTGCFYFTEDGSDGCYQVFGIGTQTVNVQRIGSGSSCQAISHIIIYTTDKPKPTPPTPTDEPTPTEEPTPTDEPTPTKPTPTEEPTETPTETSPRPLLRLLPIHPLRTPARRLLILLHRTPARRLLIHPLQTPARRLLILLHQTPARRRLIRPLRTPAKRHLIHLHQIPARRHLIHLHQIPARRHLIHLHQIPARRRQSNLPRSLPLRSRLSLPCRPPHRSFRATSLPCWCQSLEPTCL
jgi:hypothetical protein